MSSKVELFRYKPYILHCHEALFRLLKPQFRDNPILIKDYSKHLAGFHGEKNADYMVSIYPHKNARIYQGIRLNSGPYHFQMDTLIVTNMFMFILEIKNWKSEIEYDSTSHQTTQNDGEKKKGYKSPVLQVTNQRLQLNTWLQKRNFPQIPIETIAIISNPSTILTYKGESDDINKRLTHLDFLPTLLEKHYSQYTTHVLDQNTMRRLNNTLLKCHTPHKPDTIKKHNITENYFVQGIVCDDCNHYPLIYRHLKWCCTKCGKKDKNAHIQKILDFFLLRQPTITNKECRELLQIQSPRVAYRILNSMGLKYEGNNSARKYFSPKLEEFPQGEVYPFKNKSIFQDRSVDEMFSNG